MPLPRNDLVDALVNAFTLNSFDQMLDIKVQRNRERIIVATERISFDDIIKTVVIKADQDRWALDLIRGALSANPGNLELRKFVARYPEWDPTVNPAPAPGSYYHEVFMRGRRVFLKRDRFREALREIGAPGKSRVLAINGDRDTGKTYSREFLNFIRENDPTWAGRDQRIIFIDMDKCAFDPENLAEVIGCRLGLDKQAMPSDKGEQAPRRIPSLIEWLTDGIQRSAVERWWIILDGFRVQIHPNATHDLIRALIDATDRDWDRARLLLVNYEKFLDSGILVYILSEKIEPIERPDIENFFKRVYEKSGKSWDATTISQTVDEVLAQVEAQAKGREMATRLGILSAGLTNAANSLLT
jgi:Effector-associated domain 1